MPQQDTALTLSQYTQRVLNALTVTPGLRNVWVVAELSDVRLSGGHCYLELIEKHPTTGVPVARMRGIIWADTYRVLSREFFNATGQKFATGLKVMVCVSANFHSAYGLSVVISSVNPAYTLGDVLRRRNEMVQRLQDEGILTLNRTLPWPTLTQRIAVISAPRAAGFGDFAKHICENPARLRFDIKLFEAIMQGERAPDSVINALERIAAEADQWDCVVLIRGGGATSDLTCFDHYELAANIAQFPLPVIVGVGHDRDVTLLDYVGAVVVKTPTAAADVLINRGLEQLGRQQQLATDMLQAATARISGHQRQLAYYQGQIPSLGQTRLARAAGVLDRIAAILPQAVTNRLARAKEKLASQQQLVDVLSPQATLRRGYSVTRTADGRTIRDVADIAPNDTIVTTLANGTITSTAINSATS